MKIHYVNMIMGAWGLTAVLSSCGQITKDEPGNQKHGTQKPVTTVVAPQGLPQGAVIAVPVNAQGEEQPDQAQLKLLPAASQDLSDAAIAGAFAQGHAPDQEVNELDQTTSTESFHGWGRYRSYGRHYGYNNGYGYGPFNRGCHHYRFFQPIYYYAGTPYNWQYQSAYSGSGMNYYYYRQGPWGQQSYNQSTYQTSYGNTGGYPVQPIGYVN
jgi:hypothetical protein